MQSPSLGDAFLTRRAVMWRKDLRQPEAAPAEAMRFRNVARDERAPAGDEVAMRRPFAALALAAVLGCAPRGAGGAAPAPVPSREPEQAPAAAATGEARASGAERPPGASFGDGRADWVVPAGADEALRLREIGYGELELIATRGGRDVDGVVLDGAGGPAPPPVEIRGSLVLDGRVTLPEGGLVIVDGSFTVPADAELALPQDGVGITFEGRARDRSPTGDR